MFYRICLALSCSLIAVYAQTAPDPAKTIPRGSDGKPDFQGFWNLPYVPNMAVGPNRNAAAREDLVPYTDAGRKAYLEHDSKEDPTSYCWFPGVPRIMQSPYPAQIIQTKDYLVIAFEYMHMFRSINLNNPPHPENMESTFMGHSSGHWEGDTLVVETAKLKGSPWTWLDTAGHQHSDQMRVIERFRRLPESIQYEYTVYDPVMYKAPWTQSRQLTPLKVSPGLPELLEYLCTENNKDVQHLISTKPAEAP
jgi:hypothetical protein